MESVVFVDGKTSQDNFHDVMGWEPPEGVTTVADYFKKYPNTIWLDALCRVECLRHRPVC